MDNVFKILRYNQDDYSTQGILLVNKEYFCDTLELPWKDNKAFLSCIPEGEYSLKKHFSPERRELCLLVVQVQDRKAIEIHEANQVSELKGCIAVGIKSMDVILHSKEKLGLLLDIVGDTIVNLFITKV